MAESFISVGKIGKPHGLTGAFRFVFFRELKSKKKIPAHFMFYKNGNYLPWFVRELEWNGFNEGFLSFEEITTPEKAKQFSGTEIYVSEKEAETFFKDNAGVYDFLIGYKANEETEGLIGEVTEIMENPGQLLCVLKNKDEKEIIIPFVEEFIMKIDKRKKEIYFCLPDGMLEI